MNTSNTSGTIGANGAHTRQTTPLVQGVVGAGDAPSPLSHAADATDPGPPAYTRRSTPLVQGVVAAGNAPSPLSHAGATDPFGPPATASMASSPTWGGSRDRAAQSPSQGATGCVNVAPVAPCDQGREQSILFCVTPWMGSLLGVTPWLGSLLFLAGVPFLFGWGSPMASYIAWAGVS
jgi:hypothetical protein